MKTNRLALLALCSLGFGLMLGCSGGNHSADTEAPVFLSVDITKGPADIAVNQGVDVVIPTMSIKSTAKAPGAVLSPQADVTLDLWVTTFTRTDGGTVASRMWQNYYNVYVPAGGNATLENYRIMPSEYLVEPPLNQLWPANGGFDKETGQPNIRQKVRIEIFGKTTAGQKVSLAFDVTLNFFYGVVAE